MTCFVTKNVSVGHLSAFWNTLSAFLVKTADKHPEKKHCCPQAHFCDILYSDKKNDKNVKMRCLQQRAGSHTIAVTTERKGLSIMLNENIKTIRKSKGLSQEELAIKLNVVRQTISKWEQGLSVPDSDMLISISEALETPVSILLGETVVEPEADDLKVISEKLEVINLQLAQRKTARRKMLHWLCISVCAVIVLFFAVLTALNSPYLGWDYSDPETAVVGVAFHAFEWLFVRLAPIIFIGAVVGFFLTRKN